MSIELMSSQSQVKYFSIDRRDTRSSTNWNAVRKQRTAPRLGGLIEFVHFIHSRNAGVELVRMQTAVTNRECHKRPVRADKRRTID